MGRGGRGKGKSRGESKFQVKLGGNWQDYSREEDSLLKRAYMIGNEKIEYSFRGAHYVYDFGRMQQINVETGKSREIRRPYGFPPPPKGSILPPGPMTIVTVRPGQPGTTIQVPDPNNPGQQIQVFVPPNARPGSKMAIPVPGKGESVEATMEKQKKHAEEQKAKGKWSTGGKIAATGAALIGVGAVGVGGVILGDHLAGGDMAETIGETTVDVAEDVGEAIGDFGEDAVDWIGDAGEDAIDWLGDAGEDVGDFIMDLF